MRIAWRALVVRKDGAVPSVLSRQQDKRGAEWRNQPARGALELLAVQEERNDAPKTGVM